MATKKHFMAPRLFVKEKSAGYVTLLAVLLVSAAGITIAVSLISLGLGASLTGSAVERSEESRALADACAEEGLDRIHGLMLYAGTEVIPLGQGSCTFTVTLLSGQNREVTASGTVGAAVRKVKISLDQITPTIRITSWQEVADF